MNTTACPGWCAGHADGLPTHSSPIRRAGDVAVQLIRHQGADYVHFTHTGQGHDMPTGAIPANDAAGLAAIFARLGHPQLAAAITGCIQASRYEAELQRSLHPPVLSRLAEDQPAGAR